MSPMEKTQAVLLRRWDFSETSLVTALVTPDHGCIRALAKGAKRPRSPLSGALEPLTLTDIVLYRKKSPALHILGQARTVEFWRGLRADLKRFYAAHHVAELLLLGLPEELPQPEIFEAAVDTFRRLDRGARPQTATLAFEISLLRALGHFPVLDACMACRKPWKKGESVRFHPLSGGALHPACARDAGATETVTVAAGTLQILEPLGGGRLSRTERIQIPPATAKQLRELLDAQFRFLFERDLRTSRFV